MSDFRTTVLAMAQARPNARVSTIVELALAVESIVLPDLDDAAALGRWALLQPAVKAELALGKKIHAIKELRAASRCSLPQAKNAIDEVTR